jgi:hypothetical protein
MFKTMKSTVRASSEYLRSIFTRIWGQVARTAKFQVPITRPGAYLVAFSLIVATSLREGYPVIPLPGIAIGLLGVAAVIVSLRPSKSLHTWEKVGWILVASILFGVEVHSIYIERDQHDREQNQARRELNENFSQVLGDQRVAFDSMLKDSEKKFTTSMREFNQIGKTTKSIETTGIQAFQASEYMTRRMKELDEMRRPTEGAPAVIPQASPLPVKQNTELKQQALQLARELDDWIASASREVSNFQQGFDAAKQAAYAQRLNDGFKAKFVPQANLMANKLNIKGLRLACIDLEPHSHDPSFILSLHRVCAARIEEAAFNLKD